MARDAQFERILEWIRSHYFGKYRGTVTDNDDSTQRGRLKVRVPAVLGDLEVWAMPCVPYAGDGVGFYSLPEKDTGVWVEFEGGDPSYPVWTGFFWADDQLPDDSDADIKIWKTQKMTLRCDDSSDEVKLSDSEASGSTLTLASDGVKLNYSESSLSLDDDAATLESNESQVTVGVEGVSSQAVDGGAIDITATVSINDGSFEVT
jgi:uncharacterized protein involved in type VI secretion and phage assembly